MEYRHKWTQFFRKKLDVPRRIQSKIYNDRLTLSEYIEYELYGKIPVTCIMPSERALLDKFGLEKVLKLDWKLINKSYRIGEEIDFKKILLEEIPPETEDLNEALYTQVVDKILPDDYTEGMIKAYPEKVMEISEKDTEDIIYFKRKFNEGKLSLEEIIEKWEIFKEKDLDVCLSRDVNNVYGITNKDVKEFIHLFENLIPLITKYEDIYKFISQYYTLKTQGEKNAYVTRFTDFVLKKSMERDRWTGMTQYLENEEYKIIFKYSNLDSFLKEVDDYYGPMLSKELHDLSPDYIFNIDFPFGLFTTRRNLMFIATYGVKNVVEFDYECGQFFSKNNYEMLKNMYEMYLHYSGNVHDPEKTIHTRKSVDENGKYVERVYTKDEFYEAMRRMIVYGPTNGEYSGRAPNYSEMTGEFRVRYSELFVSEDAPQELQDAFYTKTVTPSLLKLHPEYIDLLEGKDIKSFFTAQYARVLDGEYYNYENIYEFLSNKLGYKEAMELIAEYADVLELIYSKKLVYYSHDIHLKPDYSKEEIQKAVGETLKSILIQRKSEYPKDIPDKLKELLPELFLPANTPKHIQDAFYSRNLNPEEVFQLDDYKKYFKDIDLSLISKPMTIWSKGQNRNYEISLQDMIKQKFGDDGIEIMLRYGKYLEKVFDENCLLHFEYNQDLSQNEILSEMDRNIYKLIVDGKTKYDSNMSEHFKKTYPSMFISEDVQQEIKDKFYNRKFELKDFETNIELLNIFGETNIICGMDEEYSWLIPLFSQNKNHIEANQNRIRVLNTFLELKDYSLKTAFKEYMMDCAEEIDIEKIEYMAQVLHRLSSSNSAEMFRFRKELAVQILSSDDPIASLDKIEAIFIKNNIPTVGKIYSCFEILHPDFKGFRFDTSPISPVLTKSSNTARKAIVFSDLIKASFGSNNRSINEYLRNIDYGNNLYESIIMGQIKLEQLSEVELKELELFSKHLVTLYNNSEKGKKELRGFELSNDIIRDITELKRLLSPNDTLDYNLADRVVNMFCHFAGIETMQEAKDYITNKIQAAEQRNIDASRQDMVLEEGDYIKGISGGILYLGNILQNGSVSKEYLGASADSDATPLDTDVSRIMSSEGTTKDKIFKTEAASYGDVYFVLKGDDRFLITRDENGEHDVKRDKDKLEIFKTGVIGGGHYGIRTGFSSSDINYIVTSDYDEKIALEIVVNGFYIPIANLDGKIIFTYQDYQMLKSKMNGLSYFGQDTYEFSENLVTPYTQELADQIEQSNEEVRVKREKINKLITSSLEEIGLQLKTSIDGDLTEGFAELIDTGSTGRGTNKPGDGDFDFIMRLDRKILSDPAKLSKLKQVLLSKLGSGINNTTSSGDFRLKDVYIEPNVKVDIDITFVEKTDQVSYSTDMCLQDRLQTIYRTDKEKYKYVVANILLAKKVLKEANAYKPYRSDMSQGGMGGVGIENWVLQHGGSFYDAATTFIQASEGKTFEEFKKDYKVWDFGENHLASKKGNYPHDNFIFANMSEDGFKKMKAALKKYLQTYQRIETTQKKR